MPTTNISSIGTGKDYATIALWEAATDYDLVAADVVEVGEVYDDGLAWTATMAGATTDATRYRHLRPNSGSETEFIVGSGRSLLVDTTLYMSEPYFRVSGLELNGQEALNGPMCFNSAGFVFSRCLFHNFGDDAPPAPEAVIGIGGDCSGYVVEDCVFLDCHGTSIEDFQDGAIPGTIRRVSVFSVLQATIVGSSSTPTIVQNTAVLGAGASFGSIFNAASVNNASSDISAPGSSPSTGLIASEQYTNINAGAEDLTPIASSVLENLGIGAWANAPAAPAGLILTPVSSTQINLAWTDNSAVETGFEVWRAPDVSGSPGTWALITTTAAEAESYNNTGLTPLTTYWYRVRAVNASGNSAYTSQVSEATLGTITVKQDGSADYTTITAGLAAASSGVTVEVQDSETYAEGVITIPAGVTLQAQTGQTPTIQGSANELINLDGANGIIDGFIVDHLNTNSVVTVSHEANGTESRNLTLRNLGGGYAVRFRGNNTGSSFHHSIIEESSLGNRHAVTVNATVIASTQIKIYCNSILGNAFRVDKDVPIRFAGNTCDGQGVSLSSGIRTTVTTTQLTVQNNIVANYATPLDLGTVDKSLWTGNVLEDAVLTGFPASNINSDPAFVGGANRHLASGSPALDLGVDASDLYTTDLDAEAIALPYDAGCYNGIGGGGTTVYRTKTIKQDGTGDYTTFADLVAALPASLVAVDEHWTVTVGDSGTYAENFQLLSTADATRTLVLQAGEGVTPTIATTGLNGLYLRTDYMTCKGFIVSGTNNSKVIRQRGTAIKVHDCDVRASAATPSIGVSVESANGEVKRTKITGAEVGLEISTDAVTVHNVLVREASTAAIRVLVNVDSCDFFHLTLDPNGGDGIYLGDSGITGNDFKNCIVKVTGAGKYAYRASAATWGADSDYNAVVAVAGAKIGKLSTTEYATLAAWQAATSDDSNSVTDEPPWTDEAGDDYSLDAPFLGVAGLGVTDDIASNARSSTPSRGAYEFLTVYAFEQPTNLDAVTASSTAINLAWTDNAISESAYEVYRAPDVAGSPGSFVLVAEIDADSTFFADTGLTTATTYWYKVRATGLAGNSAYSGNASATTNTDPPPAPSNLAAVPASTSAINLLWTDNADNEDEYEVQRAPDVDGAPGTWAEIASLDADTTHHEDTGLSAGTTYWYRVRSVVSSTPSDWAGPVSATTLAAAAVPSAPTGLTVKALDSTRLRLAWTDAATTETGYAVERAGDDGAGSPASWRTVASLPENTTDYTDVARPYGLLHWYRVRAVNLQGSSLYSSTVPGVTPEPEED